MFVRFLCDGEISISFLSYSITFELFLLSSTLGGVLLSIVDTLGAGSVMIGFILIAGLSSIAFNVGRISVRLSSLAISKIALFKSSPACSDGIPNFGGLARMDNISVAAYWMKSASLNEGNFIIVGKNSTISEITIDFVRGM